MFPRSGRPGADLWADSDFAFGGDPAHSGIRLPCKVVSKTLENAANAMIGWSTQETCCQFEARRKAHRRQHFHLVAASLGSEVDVQHSLAPVGSKLLTENTFTIPVADEIWSETKRMIEILQRQEDLAEFLGLKIRRGILDHPNESSNADTRATVLESFVTRSANRVSGDTSPE